MANRKIAGMDFEIERDFPKSSYDMAFEFGSAVTATAHMCGSRRPIFQLFWHVPVVLLKTVPRRFRKSGWMSTSLHCDDGRLIKTITAIAPLIGSLYNLNPSRLKEYLFDSSGAV